MCGIGGSWTGRSTTAEHLLAGTRAMMDAIAYRGPDDWGVWVDGAHGVALGHRRLSIVDLSAEGHQPMVSASGRHVISFNGEVYNFADVRKQVEASRGRALELRGHSDTEVMLAAIEEWGLERAVERFVGMFVFALWDKERATLSLVRDRLGIKPLYFGDANGTLVFGSELKALTAHAGFPLDVDRDALTSYFRFGYVPAPRSIYRAAKKLAPGTIVTFAAPRLEAARETVFWSAKDVAARGLSHPFEGDEIGAIDELERRLADAVKLRLVSDVPIGAFLSGGIDSSTVVSLMQRASSSPVRTFSIANEGAAFDESDAAAAVAKHLGTAHTALTVTSDDARAVIPMLPRMYDEPFADSSQIPTFLVSRLARRDVTVALSGDGGDELFGGYNRHVWGPIVWDALRRVPHGLRAALTNLLLAAPTQTWDRVFEMGSSFLPELRTPGSKVHKLARVLDVETPDELYRRLVSLWDAPAHLVRGGAELVDPPPALHADGAATMMFRDLTTYLPDDILTKVDRASMAVSLEARVPIIDHRVVEFAWSLPQSLKARDRTGKWILRQVLSRHVPRALFERPKMGFAVPLADWLRGPLRDWANDLLSPKRLRESDYLVADPIETAWSEHVSGKRDHEHALWAVLMFQAWLAA
jgi:asparagine synthase (glutamine-hydrolysing)